MSKEKNPNQKKALTKEKEYTSLFWNVAWVTAIVSHAILLTAAMVGGGILWAFLGESIVAGVLLGFFIGGTLAAVAAIVLAALIGGAAVGAKLLYDALASKKAPESDPQITPTHAQVNQHLNNTDTTQKNESEPTVGQKIKQTVEASFIGKWVDNVCGYFAQKALGRELETAKKELDNRQNNL